MKKAILIALFAALVNLGNAQSLIGGDNILKTNMSANALQNYNITYERSINHFMSISASYSTMPKRNIQLKSLAKQFIENPNIDFDNFKMANNAITFESRFYWVCKKCQVFILLLMQGLAIWKWMFLLIIHTPLTPFKAYHFHLYPFLLRQA